MEDEFGGGTPISSFPLQVRIDYRMTHMVVFLHTGGCVRDTEWRAVTSTAHTHRYPQVDTGRPKKKRHLVVVGPTNTGKTSFVDRLEDLKWNVGYFDTRLEEIFY